MNFEMCSFHLLYSFHLTRFYRRRSVVSHQVVSLTVSLFLEPSLFVCRRVFYFLFIVRSSHVVHFMNVDQIVRTVREFFASPVLLTADGCHHTARADPGRGAVTRASASMLSSSSDTAQSLAANHQANQWLRTPTALSKVFSTIIELSKRHVRSLLAVLVVFVAVKALKMFLKQRRTSSTTFRRRASKSSVSSVGSEVVVLVSHAHRVVDGQQQCGRSTTSTEISSIRSTPQAPLMLSPGLNEAVTKDVNGRLYVLQRNGDYIEVWEADEYGQVRDAQRSLYGDPEEHCEELLDHFSREASVHQLDTSQNVK